MIKKFRSIQTQFLAISIVIILMTLVTVGGLVSRQISMQARNDYFSNSNEQMEIVDDSI